MKTYPYIILAICLLMSCEQNFEELNQNPNEALNINPEYLFSESLLKGAGQFSPAVHTEIWTLMEWTQMLADLNEPTNNENYYTYSQDWNNELWKSWYVDALMPIQQVINQTHEIATQNNLHQMARIWKVFLFHRITDLWGAIPYSEALQGFTHGIINPNYDTQEYIYTDLLNELKAASEALHTEASTFDNCDLVYGGDVPKWKAFSNALSCRLALRISDVKPELSAEIFSRMNPQILMQNGEYNFSFPFYSEFLHPFYELEYTGQGMRKPSTQLINTLENDPRLEIYCEPTIYGQSFGIELYEGVPNLTPMSEMESLNQDNTSTVGAYFLSNQLKAEMMTYSEQCFILAEASLKNLYPGNTTELLREGIRAHMLKLGVEQFLIDDFLDNLGPTSIELIQTQKWISLLYLNGFEAYAEKRRTNYPTFSIENEVYSLPKRFRYPSSEYDLNGSNAPGQSTIDEQTPLWWNSN